MAMSTLESLTEALQPPCLLARRKRTLWTTPCMVRPALVRKKFGQGDLLLAISPIQHRPNYYLVWVDARWFEEETLADELDDIYEAIGAEFGSHSSDDGPYQWPMEDFTEGCSWRKADVDDVQTPGQAKRLATPVRANAL